MSFVHHVVVDDDAGGTGPDANGGNGVIYVGGIELRLAATIVRHG